MDFFSYLPVSPSSPYYFESSIIFRIAPLTFFAALAFAIVTFRSSLVSAKTENAILAVASSVALALELGQHLCEYLTKPFFEFLRGAIPLELCAISFWMAFALCYAKRRTLWEFLYFWGIGALVSLVYVNDDGAGPDRFRYYQYFGTHGFTLLAIVWFGAVKGYRISFRAWLRATASLFVLSFVIRLIDLAFSGPLLNLNYMFVVSPPEVSTPIAAFGSGWRYYFSFVTLTIVVLFIAYIPWPIAKLLLDRVENRGKK